MTTFQSHDSGAAKLKTFPQITHLIFFVKERHFSHDGYFGPLEPILRSGSRRPHELLNLVAWRAQRQQRKIRAGGKCHAVGLDNLRCSSGERQREVALSRLIMSLTICDSPVGRCTAFWSESLRAYHGKIMVRAGDAHQLPLAQRGKNSADHKLHPKHCRGHSAWLHRPRIRSGD